MTAELEAQAQRYRASLTDEVRDPLTRNRLKLMASACADHARRLRSLLAPLGATPSGATTAAYGALGEPPLPRQGLTSYYANVHRDWCWGGTENEAAYRAVHTALGAIDPGRTLVVGAGSGRLVYDLHVRRHCDVAIAADLNPLMLLVAQRMFAGDSLELYEFPLAPRDLTSHAVLRTLRSPAAAPPGLHPVFADVSTAPFAAAVFDTVITPWVIDVIDEDLATFAVRVNGWLRPGGRWINTGSLFFEHRDAARCYSRDELPRLLGDAGFGDLRVTEESVPYLASPASRHARQEVVVTFCASAHSRPAPPPQRATREWLAHSNVPVPLPPEVDGHVLAMRVHSFVASLVDGRRTVGDIAEVLVRERLMAEDEAEAAVRTFLRRLFEEAQAPWRP